MKGRDEVSADPEKCRRSRSRIEAVVGTWERADIERWFELAGFHLSDGCEPEVADQRALLEMQRVQRAREREAA